MIGLPGYAVQRATACALRDTRPCDRAVVIDAPAPMGSGVKRMARRDRADGPLDLRRPYKHPIPDSSVGSVRKVAKLDARTHVVAARTPGGRWFRLHERTRFTREHASRLRESGISEVVLRRGFARASFPLGWLSRRED